MLRAFVRYAHDRSGIRPELTAETLDAIAQWEDEYQQTIRTPEPDDEVADDESDEQPASMPVTGGAAAVGGLLLLAVAHRRRR